MAREAIIQEDTIIKGKIRNCRQMEIRGYLEGDLSAEDVLVRPGGTFYGTLKSDTADVAGSVQGEVFVKNLISIRSSGSVNGHVRYGQLAMEMGADLSAHLRNVPPKLAGDLDITVRRGRSVVITTDDITAVDPDDTPDHLTYTVSNPTNGFAALIHQEDVRDFQLHSGRHPSRPHRVCARWQRRYGGELRHRCGGRERRNLWPRADRSRTRPGLERPNWRPFSQWEKDRLRGNAL